MDSLPLPNACEITDWLYWAICNGSADLEIIHRCKHQ